MPLARDRSCESEATAQTVRASDQETDRQRQMGTDRRAKTYIDRLENSC